MNGRGHTVYRAFLQALTVLLYHAIYLLRSSRSAGIRGRAAQDLYGVVHVVIGGPHGVATPAHQEVRAGAGGADLPNAEEGEDCIQQVRRFIFCKISRPVFIDHIYSCILYGSMRILRNDTCCCIPLNTVQYNLFLSPNGCLFNLHPRDNFVYVDNGETDIDSDKADLEELYAKLSKYGIFQGFFFFF